MENDLTRNALILIIGSLAVAIALWRWSKKIKTQPTSLNSPMSKAMMTFMFLLAIPFGLFLFVVISLLVITPFL